MKLNKPRPPDSFSLATGDELWSGGRLLERRLSWGRAFGYEGGIVAGDAREEPLVSACQRALERLRQSIPTTAGRVRLMADARRENGIESVSATMTIRIDGYSIVTSPEDAANDLALLRGISSVEPSGPAMDYRALPLIWRNGSASVLLHEAVGHAAEHGHPPIEWPPWLRVDVPLSLRRASFRDVPLQRMVDVVARQESAPFTLPDIRLDVLLVGGGSYEPLTEEVALHIAAADLVAGGQFVRRLPPFEIRETRRSVARALVGAAGEPLRYPGVVCSTEGQELVVGSFAPIMLTAFR